MKIGNAIPLGVAYQTSPMRGSLRSAGAIPVLDVGPERPKRGRQSQPRVGRIARDGENCSERAERARHFAAAECQLNGVAD